ncbi:MAG: hypothetical protein HFJ37_03120 [Clostridia bacterium]|nr:hypothetical protein [Clostridia bacterium]
METFADYILEEKNLASKMEITYYLAKKKKIYFDKSTIFKTEIVRMFLNYARIEVDKDFLLTASLLCNCKKIDNAQEIESIHTYAKKGAQYLETLGFGKRFCKICEEINRYSKSNPREKESDILELVDQFGGMLLDRPERIGFKPDEALVLLEHRNLKNEDNRYLQLFKEFVNFIEKIHFSELVNMTALRKLVKIYNETEEVTKFIEKVLYNYEPKVDRIIAKYTDNRIDEMFGKSENPNRPLFSKQTAKKIMNHMDEKVIAD